MTNQLSRMRLFHLISPSLPVGSFTYSQGMEWAVENNWISDLNSLSQWLETILMDSLHWLELPILIRLYDACESNDKDEFSRWSHYLYASRETKELRLEELGRARALLMVLNKLPDAIEMTELFQWRDALLKSQTAGFSLAAYKWNISKQDMLLGYSWSWLENMVTVAIKLIPLGQSDGQIVLHQLTEKIPDIVKSASNVIDNEIGASTPALAISSSLHETQYTRLFRS